MQVEAVFPNTNGGPLEVRMSRSSPGRYSLHDFAKNVYDVHAFGPDGRELETTRPDPYGWNVPKHGPDVTVKYKVFGDRVDGTYLGIDETHAHINMPAAIMWAHGYDDRPVELTFDGPAGSNWKIATQLHERDGIFTAPNLQYLMDSPTEFGPVALREFTVNSRRFRVAMHHQGTDAELDGFVKDVEKIVRQEGAIYGEFPQYEPGSYTFLTDLLPWANGDGMEHRNSTVITTTANVAAGRGRVLDTVAHEFFHCWNVERIRPKGLEPFDFDRANLSDSLWLAEGFTQYYGSLALVRAGLDSPEGVARDFGELADGILGYPGRLVRSAAEMSEMAPFVDGGRPIDRTNWSNSLVSYYTVGGAIALALDLSLRDRTESRLSLDDYMRAMWQKFGRPGGLREGYVDHPYTIEEAEKTLADVSGDRAFAHEFFAKYVLGHAAADYGRLLARAGLVLRPRGGGRSWIGDLRYESRGGDIVISTLVSPTWPAYAAGLEEDDRLLQVDGQRIASGGDVLAVLARHQPGDTITISFASRLGRSTTGKVTLAASPHVEVVPIEATGLKPTQEQRAFRERWMGAK